MVEISTRNRRRPITKMKINNSRILQKCDKDFSSDNGSMQIIPVNDRSGYRQKIQGNSVACYLFLLVFFHQLYII